MSFDQSGFYLASTGFSERASQKFFVYETNDAIGDVKANGYFNESTPGLRLNNLLYVSASDDVELLYISSVDPDTTADLVVESTFELQPNSVTTDILVNGAVTQIKMADDSIGAPQLVNGSVGQIAMDGDSIGTAQLIDSAVTNIKLANASVGVDKLQPSSVETGSVADGAITDLKISGLNGSKIVADSVATAAIADGAITNEKLATGMWRIKTIATSAGNGTDEISLTVSGVTTSDRALAVGLEGMHTPTVSILATKCNANSVNVNLSGNLAPDRSLFVVVFSTT